MIIYPIAMICNRKGRENLTSTFLIDFAVQNLFRLLFLRNNVVGAEPGQHATKIFCSLSQTGHFSASLSTSPRTPTTRTMPSSALAAAVPGPATLCWLLSAALMLGTTHLSHASASDPRVASVSASAECGNGLLDTATEACDDSNIMSGDGCSAGCQVETGYYCFGLGNQSCAGERCTLCQAQASAFV